MTELRKCARLFKPGKASGPGDVPMEFWKTVLGHSINKGAEWLADFCNSVWSGRRVPDSWHLQRVAMIFKKGAPEDCGNYRPICSLNSAYKLFAMVVLQRLLQAGADERLWHSQYGFRQRRSTEQALHCARRALDLAGAVRDGSTCLRLTGGKPLTPLIQGVY